MKNFKFNKAFYVIMATLLISVQSFATDGYFSTGYGTINKGLAGAGIAFYQGSIINGNPAAGTFLGNNYSLGMNLFNPNRQYTVTGNPSGMPNTFGLAPGTVESDSKLFVIPSLGANWMIGEKSAISASLFGNGGMNTDYPTNTYHDPYSETTGVNLMQMFGNIGYSLKLSEKHSLGATAVLAWQSFEAKGLYNFSGFSSNPDALTDNGASSGFGYGFKIGYLGHLTDNFAIGAMYQSKVMMAEFDEYAGLFAEQGGFDIPASWTVGFSWEVVEDFTVIGDVKSIMYSSVNSIANPMDVMALMPAFPNPDGTYTPNPNHIPLGADEGSGFGWEDMMVYKLGVNYAGVDTWEFRAGVSIGNNPIPETEVMFNILAPGVIENQVSLGLSKEVGKRGNQFHVAMNYAFNSSVKGYNPMDFDAEQAMQGNMVPNQTIEIEMNQFELELGFSF